MNPWNKKLNWEWSCEKKEKEEGDESMALR